MAPKFTLVPSEYFSKENARELLSKVVLLDEGEPLSFVEIPDYGAMLVYAGERPPVYDMVMSLFKINGYNRIVASIVDGYLYLVVSQGDKLVFCNCFKAADFTTAEYYIFFVLKKLQINPEPSSIYFMSELSQAEMLSLCSYFKSAEVLQ